jgi:hypothetical protein
MGERPETAREERAPSHPGTGLASPPMRIMLAIWGVILVGGIVFFSIVGLTHG